MKPRVLGLVNGGAAVLALAASVLAASVAGRRQASVHDQPSIAGGAPATATAVTSVVDAGGFRQPVRPFRRIVAGSTVADRLLLDLAEPDRIAALTEFGAQHALNKHQYAGHPLIKDLNDLESLLALKADLLLVNNYNDRSRVARLRESGLPVFDLGEMRGLTTLGPNIRDVAALLGAPARGAAYEAAFVRRLARVAAPLGERPRRRAMYASVYGDRVFGGTLGTNYHDILIYGGLDDVAAARFRDWPQYGSEDLLALDPDLIVTKRGMPRRLCAQPALDRLRACRSGDDSGFIELDGALLDDPSLTILDTAEKVFQAAYPALNHGP